MLGWMKSKYRPMKVSHASHLFVTRFDGFMTKDTRVPITRTGFNGEIISYSSSVRRCCADSLGDFPDRARCNITRSSTAFLPCMHIVTPCSSLGALQLCCACIFMQPTCAPENANCVDGLGARILRTSSPSYPARSEHALTS